MLELLRSPSRSAAGAIFYVTVGTLMVIWAGLAYYFFVFPMPDPPPWQKFACFGTVLSGIAISLIGLLFGTIGREAKSADNTVGVAPAGPIVPMVASPVNPVAVADGRIVSQSTGRLIETTPAVVQNDVTSAVR